MRQKIFFLKRFDSELLYVQGQYGNSFRGFPLLCPCQQTIRLDFFRTGPSQIVRPECGRTHGKYRISGPSGKRRETDTQFKVSKQNSIFDLIDPYRILWKAVFDESRMYGLEGDLSYLSRSTLQYGVKKPKK